MSSLGNIVLGGRHDDTGYELPPDSSPMQQDARGETGTQSLIHIVETRSQKYGTFHKFPDELMLLILEQVHVSVLILALILSVT